MKNLVYFPTFEPLSKNWLKFSLLYMEKFDPIIPNRFTSKLSDDFRRIIDETDLIHPYNPQYEQAARATIKAIEFVEKVIQNESLYRGLFNSRNIIDIFTNPRNRQYKLYNEKYSWSWGEYCKKNNFGEETNDGILVSKELGFIFMKFLAEEIAFEEGKSIITDNNTFDNFLNYHKSIPKEFFNRQKLAKGVLSLTLPKNISEIPISKLIKFRNDNSKKIRAFNIELDIVYNNIQDEVKDEEFVKRFNSIYSELTVEIITQGVGIVTIPLTSYILLSNQNISQSEYLNLILGGLGIVLNATIAVSHQWRDILNLHNCRRYLTNLGRLD